MDWTYGTNNLGFHLGILLVASATGRGVPVLDFIPLDEKMQTMEAILEFFKKKNTQWMAPKHVAAPLTTPSTSAASVEYVHLRREEQANVIVLSDAEKDARAQALFELVVRKLSGLSTVTFYQEMNKWKSVIECDFYRVVQSGGETSSNDVRSTAIESDSDSDGFFCQLDVAAVMAEMEADQELAMEGDLRARFARERAVATPGCRDEEYLDSFSLSEGSDVEPTQTSEKPQQMSDATNV
ncbi:hypothetical protein JG688_00001520 [Phytophthora aleatoria]|uniref:ZSWIM1/3 RNaseH-like domain-containing protein n=1 Tax=Phytophthora aleatoria TaxID=2496075 RepID=A0A8J5IYR7_9STRA|nr:hypothetical protein JG688_00001520 [Phytophthora aleatoria]